MEISRLVTNPAKYGESSTSGQNLNESKDKNRSKRTLSDIFVTKVSDEYSFFTCRVCFKTFTKQSWAMTHSCIKIEDNPRTKRILKNQPESIPPLKIRLFSLESGWYVCHICQAPFENKESLIEHLKKHFVNDDEKSKNKKKNMKSKAKKIRRYQPETEKTENLDEACKKDLTKTRKKSNSEVLPNQGKPNPVFEWEEPYGSCSKYYPDYISSAAVLPPPEETAELATHLSGIREEETPMPLMLPLQEQDGTEVKIENEYDAEIFFEEDKLGFWENNENISDNFMEFPTASGSESRPDEMTALDIINEQISGSFHPCAFCDKTFGTLDALTFHQNQHWQTYSTPSSHFEERRVVSYRGKTKFLCSFCPSKFSDLEAIQEHEYYHQIADFGTSQISEEFDIPSDYEFADLVIEPECQISIEQGFIMDTVTTAEKKKRSTKKKVRQTEFK